MIILLINHNDKVYLLEIIINRGDEEMSKTYENAYAKSIRITRETHEQLRLIASYQRRSMRVCLELMIEQKLESLNEGKETK